MAGARPECRPVLPYIPAMYVWLYQDCDGMVIALDIHGTVLWAIYCTLYALDACELRGLQEFR